MKKIVSTLTLLIMLSLLLLGCSGEDNTAGIEARDMRKYDEFMAEFNKLVSKLPEYTILQLEDIPLDDNSVSHTFSIKDTVLDETYRLRVDTNEDNEIIWVFLSTERKTYGNLQFAVFSFYVYESMGLPEMDADIFYNKYDLFSKREIFESDTCQDYEITSMTIDITNEITFSIQIADSQ